MSTFNPFPNDKFRLFQTKKFADDNCKFSEDGRKLSKRVENTVGKGEIACPQCFQKTCSADT